jgi:hypothetical protein
MVPYSTSKIGRVSRSHRDEKPPYNLCHAPAVALSGKSILELDTSRIDVGESVTREIGKIIRTYSEIQSKGQSNKWTIRKNVH